MIEVPFFIQNVAMAGSNEVVHFKQWNCTIWNWRFWVRLLSHNYDLPNKLLALYDEIYLNDWFIGMLWKEWNTNRKYCYFLNVIEINLHIIAFIRQRQVLVEFSVVWLMVQIDQVADGAACYIEDSV